MRTRSCLVTVLVLAIGLSSAIGCVDTAPTQTGITIPLVHSTSSGNVYRLTASFEITAPGGATQTVDTSAGDSELVVSLDPGVHTIRLLDGWALERSQNGGTTFAGVPALLASSDQTGIRVVPNRTVMVGFEFIVRETTGNLRITFGVVDPPRQLSGGIRFTEGIGDYAPYVGRAIDIQIYFSPDTQRTTVELDGTHDRTYESSINALEFFNDPHGLVAPLGSGFSGGLLTFITRIHGDATQDFSAYYGGAAAEITFGTSTDALISSDADGFPADAFFYATGSPIEVRVNGEVILRGVLQSIRQFI